MAIAATHIPTVVLIGRPNVGKSSLFNRLVGRRTAITDNQAGTTRDAHSAPMSWNGYHFNLIDTAGVLSAHDDIEIQSQDQIKAALSAADVVVQVIDATTMLTPEDLQAAQLAHLAHKPFITVANKIDANQDAELSDFAQLGTEAIVGVSALQGTGSGDLLDEICRRITKLPAKPTTDNRLRIAILGRPNVGKSSLFNTLIGKQTAVVSNKPGTTRDVGQGEVRYHRRPVDLLDTAGMRRPGSVERGVEKFSVLRTLASINQADVCVLVIDATEPATAMDQRIAGLVIEAGKGLIIAVNKWDIVEREEKDQGKFGNRMQSEFQFAWWAPLVFISAETGLNVTRLFELAAQIAERRHQTLPTGPLNRLLETLITKQPPVGGRRQPKINYVTQTGSSPVEITLFGANLDDLHFSYRRYLENGLREHYDLVGTPIGIATRSKPPRGRS